MGWLFRKIQDLQAKTYAERVRFLRLVVIAAAIIILGVWIITIRFRGQETDSKRFGEFQGLWENMKKLRELRFTND